MNKEEQIEQYVIKYPFHRGTYWDSDEDGCGQVDTWIIGPDKKAKPKEDNWGNLVYPCDGWGKMIITVIGRFKPTGYPERVFYTRQWEDPSGKRFGKKKVHIKASAWFKHFVKGYRYHCELRDVVKA